MTEFNAGDVYKWFNRQIVKIVPVWFDLLEWGLIVGLIQYTYELTGNGFLRALVPICSLLVWFYITSILRLSEFGYSTFRRRSIIYLLLTVVTFFFASVFWYLITIIVAHIPVGPP